MECSRCPLAPVVHAFIEANVDKSLGRTKSRQIHAAVRILKDKMDSLCSSCSSLSKKVHRQIDKLKAAWNDNNAELFRLVSEADSSKADAVSQLQSAFSAVCLVCSRDSNDDNPSNHGQTFYSLDSGSCNANSGKARHSATDDNVVLSRADWIGSHASVDYTPSSYGADPRISLMEKEELALKTLPSHANSQAPTTTQAHDPHSSSTLPPDIEDTLRKEFSNFASLDIIDKMLLSCIISGMNIAEFAKMLWLPFSIVNPLDRTIRPITKQAAHARWTNIIRRFPTFAAIASASIARRQSTNRPLSRREISLQLLNPNADLPDNQFSNGKPLLRNRKNRSSPHQNTSKNIAPTHLNHSSRLSASQAVSTPLSRAKSLSSSNPKSNSSSPLHSNLEPFLPGLA